MTENATGPLWVTPEIYEELRDLSPESAAFYRQAPDLEQAGRQGATLFFEKTPKGLTLHPLFSPKLTPLCLDLARDLSLLKNLSGPFWRALGKHKEGVAIDGTAGLLGDALFLLRAGLEVQAYEAHPLLYLLGREALIRAGLPIKLHFGPAQNSLQEAQCQLIFLDPMFPPKKKSGSPGKEMQILEFLLGIPQDEKKSEELLLSALKSTAQRVLVKRPLWAPVLLGSCKESFKGKAVRYDLYLPLERKKK